MQHYSTPLAVGVLVIIIGTFVITFFDLYYTVPHVDKILHVSGGFIIAWFFSQFWFDKLKDFGQLERLVFFMAIAALVGIFWEIAELSTSFPPLSNFDIVRHYLYHGSLIDTLGDLTADIFGATLFALIRK